MRNHPLSTHQQQRLAIPVVVALVLLSACSQNPPSVDATLENESPHLCQFLPERALQTIFSTDESFDEHVNDDLGVRDSYSCDSGAGSPTSVGISLHEGEFAEFSYRTRLEDDPPDPRSDERLPDRMGTGWYT